jgi:hypothetical protein
LRWRSRDWPPGRADPPTSIHNLQRLLRCRLGFGESGNPFVQRGQITLHARAASIGGNSIIGLKAERDRPRCTLHISAIPKGLCPPAQGCEERATLGNSAGRHRQPQRGCVCIRRAPRPQPR